MSQIMDCQVVESKMKRLSAELNSSPGQHLSLDKDEKENISLESEREGRSSNDQGTNENITTLQPRLSGTGTNELSTEHHERKNRVSSTDKTFFTALWKDIEGLMMSDITDEAQTTRQMSSKLNQIVFSLVEENYCDESSRETCLQLCRELDVFNRVYEWMASNKNIMKEMATELLTLYSKLLALCSDEIFRSDSILEPLLVLMLALRPDEKQRLPLPLEIAYLKLLNNLTLRLVDPKILEILSYDRVSRQGYKLPKFSFLGLILHYIHREGEVGDLARDSLLVCMQLTSCNEPYADYVTEQSNCCAILAAGLTGFYSLLPTTLSVAAEDWYCLTRDMCDTLPELGSFLRGLLFLCDVVKLGHPKVYKRILDLIHDGFFLSVVGPALVQPSTEGKVAAVAILDLMLRELNEAVMIKEFLKFLLLDYCDGKPLLNSLISYIESNSQQLCIVTLQLFKTLADLNCEDVVYYLVLRYLIPCSHILPNQKRIIKELDFYCKSATMFLYLIPNCCLENSKLCKTRVSNGYPILGEASDAEEEKIQSDEKGLALCCYPLSLESFMDYLHFARVQLFSCKWACRCWSAVYDGMDVMTELPRRSSTKSSRKSTGSAESNTPPTLMDGMNKRDRSSGSLVGGTKSRTLTGDSGSVKNPTDCLGPFLNAIFDRLELMMENSFYINLALTDLLSRIACYPQPLLRSFLLNSNLVLQPGVRSLFQILTTVANKTDMFVSQIEDHQRLITTARANLFKRQDHLSPSRTYTLPDNCMEERISMSSQDTSFEASSDGTVEFYSTGKGVSPKRMRRFNSSVSQNTLPVKKENPKDAKRSASITSSPGPGAAIIGLLHPAIRHSPKSPAKRQGREASPLKLDPLQRRKNQIVIRNAIYCALVLEEWLQELAAVSLEQNLL